jgi:hypothetical protein
MLNGIKTRIMRSRGHEAVDGVGTDNGRGAYFVCPFIYCLSLFSGLGTGQNQLAE